MTANESYRVLCRELEKISESPSFEAFELLAGCAGLSRTQVLTGSFELSGEQVQTIDAALLRRLNGEPLQYILGEWTFYGRPFSVGEGVLIPRADTETLVEAALSLASAVEKPHIADLCAGSGCIAVTLARELSGSSVDAFEKSGEAYSYLTRNIARHGAAVRPFLFDVCASSAGLYDMIVSNPPYLSAADMARLQKEVSFEPAMALAGGADGLDFYRIITRRWKPNLKNGGALLYEVGAGQSDSVSAILSENGFSDICTWRDLCGIIRVVGGINTGNAG